MISLPSSFATVELEDSLLVDIPTGDDQASFGLRGRAIRCRLGPIDWLILGITLDDAKTGWI